MVLAKNELGDNPHVDLQITLRCNAYCKNCSKFCNKGEVTGLDYYDSDMTLDQIDLFIKQVWDIPLHSVCVGGGEPTLHPQLEEIMHRLAQLPKVENLFINSNMILPAPEKLKKCTINHSKPENNHLIHNCVFVHPEKKMTYEKCTHYRKPTICLNYLGYTPCCAADAYVRLFCYEDLIFDEFPIEVPENMDKVCEHCPFGHEDIHFESDLGCPVSYIYKKEADKNRLSRKITKRFGKK